MCFDLKILDKTVLDNIPSSLNLGRNCHKTTCNIRNACRKIK